MKKKKVLEHSVVVAYIVMCIAVGVLFNVVMDIISTRVSLDIDMTKEQIYELSEQTLDVLGGLEDDITINILMKESDFSTKNFFAQVNELLLRYQEEAKGKISLKYIDVYSNPGFVDKYSGENLTEGSVIVETDNSYRTLNIDELYQVQYDSVTGEPYIQGIKAEQKITSSIIYITQKNVTSVVLLGGHGEQYSNEISTIFEEAGFDIKHLNLSINDIPADTAMLLLSGPTSDYTESEIKKIDDFLKIGGDMMVFSNVYAGELPVLDRYFEGWGVKFDQKVVLDQKYCLPGYPMQIYGALSESQIYERLENRTDKPLVVPGSKPINMETKIAAGWSREALLYSSKNAYVKALDVLDGSETLDKNESDESGQYVLAATAQHSMMVDGKEENSRIVFFGTHLITSDSLLAEPSWLNGPFLTECINYASEQTDAVTITPKQMNTDQMIVSNNSSKAIFWITVIILPLTMLGCGYVQWSRRRSK